MEVVLGILGVIFVIGLIGILIEMVQEWYQSINWGSFLLWLIGGGIALAVLFSFTAEGVLVIIGAYLVLIVFSLFMGAFKH